MHTLLALPVKRHSLPRVLLAAVRAVVRALTALLIRLPDAPPLALWPHLRTRVFVLPDVVRALLALLLPPHAQALALLSHLRTLVVEQGVAVV